METEGSGATRAGDGDDRNEDAFLVEDGLGLYVVCDGSERSAAGEIASRVAVAALEGFVEEARARFGDALWNQLASRKFAGRAIRHALNEVVREAHRDEALSGMSTTATMLLTHRKHGVIGHVGDSRAYLIRDAEIHQLTVDHELTEDTGGNGTVLLHDVDAFSIALRPGDLYVLCTDGAERIVEDPEIVRTACEYTPRALAARIVAAARRVDPDQDATVVVVRVSSDDEPAWLSLSDPPQSTGFGHTVAAA